MSNFTKTFDVNTTFEDDQITLVMSRMKRKDAFKLIPYMGEPDKEGNVKVSFAGQIELMNVAADLLPKYIKEMKGLKDEEGNAISIEDMLNESYFLDLVGIVLNELMLKSFMGKQAIKKLNEPLEKSMESSSTTSTST
mgnify:CR=1 FL=1